MNTKQALEEQSMIPESGCYMLTYVMGPPMAISNPEEAPTVDEYRDLTLDEIAVARDGIGHVTIMVWPGRYMVSRPVR